MKCVHTVAIRDFSGLITNPYPLHPNGVDSQKNNEPSEIAESVGDQKRREDLRARQSAKGSHSTLACVDYHLAETDFRSPVTVPSAERLDNTSSRIAMMTIQMNGKAKNIQKMLHSQETNRVKPFHSRKLKLSHLQRNLCPVVAYSSRGISSVMSYYRVFQNSTQMFA